MMTEQRCAPSFGEAPLIPVGGDSRPAFLTWAEATLLPALRTALRAGSGPVGATAAAVVGFTRLPSVRPAGPGADRVPGGGPRPGDVGCGHDQ
ncbi:hypothetical protein [Streptomyces sp. MJM8645]|uniref:hypothetical protein n=2 Tax=Kitasatosporales TaxID=85011 RepID=UPI0007AF6674|nr:hypothetical protein [Streptomyces sp. MJM8645]